MKKLGSSDIAIQLLSHLFLAPLFQLCFSEIMRELVHIQGGQVINSDIIP